jgi:hypothetical protein
MPLSQISPLQNSITASLNIPKEILPAKNISKERAHHM